MEVDYKFLNKKRGTSSGALRPQHKLPFSKKRSTDNGEASTWGINAVDYYEGKSSITSAMKDEMRKLQRLANGILLEEDYTHVLFPYGQEQRDREELQGDPAKLRNFDIVSPVLDRVVGDYMMRDAAMQVVATNSDVEERRQGMIKEQLKEGMMQQFRNALAQQGMDTGFTTEDAELQIDQILSNAKDLPDPMTVKGQEALDYIIYYNEIERKIRMGLGDYLSVGRVFSYRDVFRDNTVYEIVDPVAFNYLAAPETEFVENGESAKLTKKMTVGEVIDFFREDLSDKEIDYLESEFGGKGGGVDFSGGGERASTDVDNKWKQADLDTFFRNSGMVRQDVSDTIDVTHVVFRSKRKLGKLLAYNVNGQEDYLEVDEDFKPRKGEEVEWTYVDEIWEGYKFAKLYKRVQPLPLQRGSIEKPAGCPLPYNGRTYGHRTSLPNTIVKKGQNHQEIYNILKYRLERTIAKNKDKFTVIPLGLIPEGKKDMDMFSMMYYTDYHGMMFIDETNPKAMQALQALKAVDVSMREYIKFLHDICISIRAEYLEIVGIPRQAMADIKASDDVGNTSEALNQTSIILESTFVSFEEFIEKDYTALLNLSKFAWIDGKKSQFLNARGELTMLDVDPYSHAAADYSIFVKGTKAEREKLRAMRGLTQAFAQNSATPTMIGRILQANNFDALMRELTIMEQQINSQQQASAESEQAAVQADLQDKEKERELKYYKTDADNRTKENIAVIKEQGSLSAAMLSNGEVEGAVGRANQALDDIFERGQQSNIEWAKNQTAREKSATDFMIAKENKNQYDVTSK